VVVTSDPGAGFTTGRGEATESGATIGPGAAATAGLPAFFSGACYTIGTTATTGAGEAISAGLAAFFFLDPVRWAEDGEEGTPAAGVLCFLVGFGAILYIKLLGNVLVEQN
jgi:hypothetical protein